MSKPDPMSENLDVPTRRGGTSRFSRIRSGLDTNVSEKPFLQIHEFSVAYLVCTIICCYYMLYQVYLKAGEWYLGRSVISRLGITLQTVISNLDITLRHLEHISSLDTSL